MSEKVTRAATVRGLDRGGRRKWIDFVPRISQPLRPSRRTVGKRGAEYYHQTPKEFKRRVDLHRAILRDFDLSINR